MKVNKIREAMPLLSPFPKKINVEVTNLCNMDCVMCPRSRMKRTKGFMDEELFRKLVNECVPHEPKLWLHYAGEPLLHPGLTSMIKLAKSAGISSVGFATNALLLDAEMARRILDSGLDRIQFSIDAASADVYRQVRRNEFFDQIVANVQGFLTSKKNGGYELPHASVHVVSLKKNENELDAFVQLWTPFLGENDRILKADFYTWAGSIPREQGVSPSQEYSGRPCEWPWTSCVVLWNGTVTLCCADYDAEVVMGSVRQNALTDIWQGEQYQLARQAQLGRNLAQLSVCQRCDGWMYDEVANRLVDMTSVTSSSQDFARKDDGKEFEAA